MLCGGWMVKNYILSVIKALVISYILSASALFVLAALLYYLDIKSEQIRIGMLITYAAACFAGGFYIGRKVKKREFLWGLIVGMLYYSIHMGAVVAIEGSLPDQIVPATALALLCMGSGMFGGMVG